VNHATTHERKDGELQKDVRISVSARKTALKGRKVVVVVVVVVKGRRGKGTDQTTSIKEQNQIYPDREISRKEIEMEKHRKKKNNSKWESDGSPHRNTTRSQP
jgi:hypothetical protein